MNGNARTCTRMNGDAQKCMDTHEHVRENEEPFKKVTKNIWSSKLDMEGMRRGETWKIM